MAKTKTPQIKPSKPAANTTPRTLKKPEYKSFRLQKRIKSSAPKLPGGLALLKRSITLLMRNWKPFLGIVVSCALLHILLVQNFNAINVGEAKASFAGALSGNWTQLWGGFSLFTILVGSSGATATELAGVYQFIIMFLSSLAVVWALRQVVAGQKVRIRDGFYEGMYPLVPVLLVVVVILLQLLPFLLGMYAYSLAGPPAFTTAGVEGLVWGALLFMLMLLSLYMLSSSLFALYIACLPGMAPMAALRSARKLVTYRRWLVMRRLLLLPLVLFVIGAAVLIPVIMLVTPAAVWVFFGMSLLALPVIHAYMYNLYRELLREKA